MGQEDLERFIRAEKRNARSTDEQVNIALAMADQGIGPAHEGIVRSQIEDELGLDLHYNAGTSLGHLVEIELIEEFTPPGPTTFVISQRLDEIILGRVEETAAEDIELLIDHMQDDDPADADDTVAVADGSGTTVRRVLSNRFDIVPDAVEQYLRTGDQVEKLNASIDALEEHDDAEVGDDYDRIIFRNVAYRYRLTERAVSLLEA